MSSQTYCSAPTYVAGVNSLLQIALIVRESPNKNGRDTCDSLESASIHIKAEINKIIVMMVCFSRLSEHFHKT